MDCQQILELNTGSASEAAQSDLKYIYPETYKKLHQIWELWQQWIPPLHKNVQEQIYRNLLIHHVIAFWITVSQFSFQNQLKASFVDIYRWENTTKVDILKPTVAVRKSNTFLAPQNVYFL